MSPTTDASTTKHPQEVTARIADGGVDEAWRLVEDAPSTDLSTARDPRGARRGLLIVLVVGALFWAGLAALFILRR